MEKFKTIDEVLNFAISSEEEAAQFYTMLAGRVPHESMKKVFHDFAREEMGHKAKLQKVKEGKITISKVEKVMDLKIADYVDGVEVKPDMDYQEALVLAMKREKAAFKLYSELASMAETDEMKNVFLSLAQEEAKHKLRFEIEYDDSVLGEN